MTDTVIFESVTYAEIRKYLEGPSANSIGKIIIRDIKTVESKTSANSYVYVPKNVTSVVVENAKNLVMPLYIYIDVCCKELVVKNSKHVFISGTRNNLERVHISRSIVEFRARLTMTNIKTFVQDESTVTYSGQSSRYELLLPPTLKYARIGTFYHLGLPFNKSKKACKSFLKLSTYYTDLIYKPELALKLKCAGSLPTSFYYRLYDVLRDHLEEYVTSMNDVQLPRVEC